MAEQRSSLSGIWMLVVAQSLGGAAAPIIFSLAGLIGQQLAPNPAYATLPVSLYTLGLALSTIAVAMLMRRFGRRFTYILAGSICMTAAIVAIVALLQKNFLLFCGGTFIAGFHGASVQNYRFAAADLVPTALKPQAISRIMVGGLAAAIIGPQVVIWTRDAWPGLLFAGSFVGMACVVLVSLPFLSLLHPAPAQQMTVEGSARSLLQIARSPQFFIAALAGLMSYGLMSFIMTAAPLAMVAHGHTVGEAALGIQWHVLAMFAPSFITGRLILRFGKIRITALGLMLIAAAGLLALRGSGLVHYWGALILLGAGWNFGFIGATALVTDACLPAERAKVQALNDFLVFGTVAAASFSSGQLLNASGWHTINLLLFPPVLLALVMLTVLSRLPARAA